MGEKIEKLKKINRLANEGIKKKVKRAREDKRHIALVLVELFLVFVLVLSLLFLFDPNLSFPDSDKIPWPVKMLVFLVTVLIAFKLYSYTKEFRFEEMK